MNHAGSVPTRRRDVRQSLSTKKRPTKSPPTLTRTQNFLLIPLGRDRSGRTGPYDRKDGDFSNILARPRGHET